MVKLLGVSASTRVWGNCEAAAKSVLVAAREAGAKIDFIRLTDFNIEPCRGCFRCLARGKRCPSDDDLYRLLAEFQQADAIILGAPVYFLSPPAALVGLMDRLLTMGSLRERREAGRPAVTVTIMGNHKWRGVAEPLINMTVSLLGFDIAESMSLVSEGPGEILSLDGVVERFGEIGRALALGEPLQTQGREGTCPVCRADFFRIETGRVICPVCGAAGELGAFAEQGSSAISGDEARWGILWLDKHIEDWVAPSVERYRGKLKSVFKNLRYLKDRYSAAKERGEVDV